MKPSDLSPEVRLATECSAALDRGETELARRLAEEGLERVTATGSSTWIRRFRHLLRVASGTSIEGPPAQPTSCSFCHATGSRIFVAGTRAFICDQCIRLCSRREVAASPIDQVVAYDGWCSFCSRKASEEPVFAANGFYICRQCVEACVEIVAESNE
jgi:hypothetical protein